MKINQFQLRKIWPQLTLGLNWNLEPAQVRFIYILRTTELFKQYFILTKADEFYAFGHNRRGLLATGDTEPVSESPRRIDSLCGKNLIDFAAGGQHVLALTRDGQVFSWGNNDFAQLGIGAKRGDHFTPQLVKFKNSSIRIKAIACTCYTSLALSEDGKMYIWGSNESDVMSPVQIPKAAYLPRKVPDTVPADDSIVDINASAGSLYARTRKGRLFAWGDNRFGSVGKDTDEEIVKKPSLVKFNDTKIEMAISADMIATAIDHRGILWMWGGFLEPICIPESLKHLNDCINLIRCGSSIAIVTLKGDCYILQSSDIAPWQPIQLRGANAFEAILDNSEIFHAIRDFKIEVEHRETDDHEPMRPERAPSVSEEPSSSCVDRSDQENALATTDVEMSAEGSVDHIETDDIHIKIDPTLSESGKSSPNHTFRSSGDNNIADGVGVEDVDDNHNHLSLNEFSYPSYKLQDSEELFDHSLGDLHFISKGSQIRCHRSILASRSRVFDRLIRHEWKSMKTEQDTDEFHLTVCIDHDFDIFRKFIRFLYTGRLTFNCSRNKVPGINHALGLYELMLKYDVKCSLKACLDYIKANLKEASFDQVVDFLESLADTEEAKKNLRGQLTKEIVGTIKPNLQSNVNRWLRIASLSYELGIDELFAEAAVLIERNKGQVETDLAYVRKRFRRKISEAYDRFVSETEHADDTEEDEEPAVKRKRQEPSSINPSPN